MKLHFLSIIILVASLAMICGPPHHTLMFLVDAESTRIKVPDAESNGIIRPIDELTLTIFGV